LITVLFRFLRGNGKEEEDEFFSEKKISLFHFFGALIHC